MKTVLVISSFVAASRVGANASAFCLERLGHRAVILPTTLMGRHPGWGDPGGGAVDAQTLREMWRAIKAQSLKFDAVLSGYMGAQDHIPIASEIIRSVKAQNPKALVLVDPVMGDHGKLYIPNARAEAITRELVPLADILTPNLWELSYLTGQDNIDTAAESLGAKLLVTSVTNGNQIGAVYRAAQTHHIYHRKFKTVPHGGGDAFAGLFLGHTLSGHDDITAMEYAVSGVFEMMQTAHKNGLRELPLIETQDKWARENRTKESP